MPIRKKRFQPTLRIWRSSHCNAVNYTFGPWRPKSSFEWHIKYWETTRMCLQKSALTSSVNRPVCSSRINYWVAPTTPVWTPQTIFSIPPLSKLVRRYFFRENVSNRPELDKQTSLVWEHIILKFYLASLSFSDCFNFPNAIPHKIPSKYDSHKSTSAFNLSIITTIKHQHDVLHNL